MVEHFGVIAGTVLRSNIALPELLPVDACNAEFAFEVVPRDTPSTEPITWFLEYPIPDRDQTAWLRVGKYNDGYLLRFVSCGDFHVSHCGTMIRAYPLPHVPLETIRHLLLDQVFPLALGKIRQFALHASAVILGSEAVGIVATSGCGKSTLAADFAFHGAPLLTDDCLVLEASAGGWRAMPYYPGVRLWPDNIEHLFAEGVTGNAVAHYLAKLRVGGHGVFPFSSEPARLRHLFLLGEPSAASTGIAIEPASHLDAFIALGAATFLLDARDHEMLRRHLKFVSGLVESVFCYKLNFPRCYDVLPAVREAVMNCVDRRRPDHAPSTVTACD